MKQIQPQINLAPLTDIEKYNIRVLEWKIPQNKRAITEMAIKLFKDNAQRNKLSIARYNEEARKFNDLHGYLIELKQDSSIQTNTQPLRKYQYINYPMIDRAAKHQTMMNFHQYVTRYNIQVKEHNQTNPSTKKQTVKLHASKSIFDAMLSWYSDQIKQRNLFNYQINVPTSINRLNPPKLKIDQRKLSNHRSSGLQMLGVSKKTVYNHLQRFKESGIIIDYEFTNSNHPVKLRINPQILVISDGNPPKKQKTDNQLVTNNRSKKLPDNTSNTRTFLLKKEKNKEIASNQLKGNDDKSSNFACLADSYKNTSPINHGKKGNNLNSAAEILKKIIPDIENQEKTPRSGGTAKKSSEILRQKIISDKDLVQKLANNEYFTYQALRYNTLEREVMYGFLTKDEFRLLMVQEFWKIASKIYKHRSQAIVPGIWMNTIKYYSSKLFIASNGLALTKSEILNKMREYRWRIGMAQRWFSRTKLEPMLPTLYFDPLRTDQRDLGFAGTKSMFKTHLRYLSEKQTDQEARKQAAIKRKAKNSAIRKIERKTLQYIKGIITIESLYDYVTHNHSDYLNSLPGLIEVKRATYYDENR